MICLDIFQIIVDYLEIREQLNVLSVCKLFNDELKIKKLRNNKNLNDIILKQKKFSCLEELDANRLKELGTFSEQQKKIDEDALKARKDFIQKEKEIAKKYAETTSINK